MKLKKVLLRQYTTALWGERENTQTRDLDSTEYGLLKDADVLLITRDGHTYALPWQDVEIAEVETRAPESIPVVVAKPIVNAGKRR
jgi:hypothetical protein